MRGSISTVLLYSGYPNFIPSALESLANQTRSADEICMVDMGGSIRLSEVLGKLPNTSHYRVVERKSSEEPFILLLDRAMRELRGDYFLFIPAHNLLAPDFFSVTAGLLDSNDICACALTDVKLFGLEDAILTPSIVELLAFPERDFYPLFRAESLRKIGGFTEPNEKITIADAVLRLIDIGQPVIFHPQWLVLSRYEDMLHNPQLHKCSNAFDRIAFLNRFDRLIKEHARDLIICLEKEHLRQFHRAEQTSGNVYNVLFELRKKHADLEKLHNDALSSVLVTGIHFLSALKRKIFALSR